MTLPVIPSSSLSLSQIQAEFGGANPISMGEYYSGGSYVGSSVANSTGVVIPASGNAIKFSNFSGASAIIEIYSGSIREGYSYSSYAPTFDFYTYKGLSTSIMPDSYATPATLIDSKTLVEFYDYQHRFGGPYGTILDQYSVITITGFSSEPTIGYLTGARLGSGTKLTPAGYNYNPYSGTATWLFYDIFGFSGSGTPTVKIYR